jgi:serine phosphatase RsbU (regulator of sigma subunit)
MTTDIDQPQVMQCMEVWGGNAVADRSVSMPGLDAWVYCKPFENSEAGGDVYYLSSCATGRIARLLVADVSGHGAAVRDIAVALRTLMRRYVNCLDQCQFVRSMNRQFTELSSAGSFATAVVTTFFAPTNELTLCSAGHPAPLLYRAVTRQWSLLDSKAPSAAGAGAPKLANIPLGIDDVEYEQFSVQLDIGDLVLCYSDSLIEARDASGELLGEKGLLALARQLDASDSATLVPSLLSSIASIRAGNLAGDDVTVMLFRPNGSAPAVPLRLKLAAPLRVLRAAVSGLLSGGPIPLPDLRLANIGGAIIDRFNRG